MKKEISYNFMQRPKEDLRNPDILIEIIEDLEEQIKRLNKEQQDTIHINVLYRGCHYSVDTQIKWDFKDGDYAYIADDSKDPTKVKIIGHKILNSAGSTDFILTETIYNPNTKETEERCGKSLYKTKKQAIEAYYNYHYGQLYQQSPAYTEYKKESEVK